MPLSPRSLSRMEGVHPDLVAVVKRAAEIGPDFIVVEGLRSKERQKELRDRGASRTLNSRHITGHAIDLADVKADYAPADMLRIAAAMKLAAADLEIPLEWGGDWKSFKDTPHFQLPWKQYPADSSPIKWADRVGHAAKVATSARVATGVVAGGGAVAAGAPDAATKAAETVSTLPSLPSPPDLSAWTAWQGFGDSVSSLASWVGSHPVIAAMCASWALGMAFLPQIVERIPWLSSSRSS